MSASRVALCFAALVSVLAVATPARPDGEVVGGKATNKLTVPFSGTIAGSSENIDITGNVLVNTIHFPGFPEKPVKTSFKIAKGGTGVGQMSGQTYTLEGNTKFKHFIPGAAYPTEISYTSPPIKLKPISPDTLGPGNIPPGMILVELNYDGSGLVTGALASIQAPPTLGSCTQVIEVCN